MLYAAKKCNQAGIVSAVLFSGAVYYAVCLALFIMLCAWLALAPYKDPAKSTVVFE